MQQPQLWRFALVVWVIGCARYPNPGNSPRPVPRPVVSPPQQPLPGPKLTAPHTARTFWTFGYAPGTYTYQITDSATVYYLSDTNSTADTARTLPPKVREMTITMANDSDVHNAIHEVAIVPPAGPQPTFCDTTAAGRLELEELIPKIPQQLYADSLWHDSVLTTVCLNSIPSQLHIQRTYTVSGDTLTGGDTLVRIRRSETISATGEGTIGEHRVFITAAGGETGSLYLDPSSGNLRYANGTQQMNVDVTTSGKTTHFVQRIVKRATLLRAAR